MFHALLLAEAIAFGILLAMASNPLVAVFGGILFLIATISLHRIEVDILTADWQKGYGLAELKRIHAENSISDLQSTLKVAHADVSRLSQRVIALQRLELIALQRLEPFEFPEIPEAPQKPPVQQPIRKRSLLEY